MKISMILNGKKTEAEIDADMLLIDFVRSQGCYSVKRGCETIELRAVYGFSGGKTGAVVFGASGAGEWMKVDTLEGLQGGSRRIWFLYCRTGRRAVRVLQSGDDYECDCAVPGKSGSE